MSSNTMDARSHATRISGIVPIALLDSGESQESRHATRHRSTCMIPERYSPNTYAVFRMVFGFLWIFHGLQKYGVFGTPPLAMASLRGVAGVIEIVVGSLIMIGFLTKPAAFLASGEMA